MDGKVKSKGELFGHPKGLYVLFFAEMWERFSFYGVRAILVLYMVAAIADGGLGWTQKTSLLVLGLFEMGVYLLDVPGGLIADRWLGARKCVWFGCLLIMAGNFALVLPGLASFSAGLSLIVLGTGLLKPNISTMVSRLYADGDARRDSAFTIFYLGINVGSFFSGLVVGYLAMKFGWRMGFLASGFGMLLGQGVYVWGQRHLRGADRAPERADSVTAREPLSPADRRRIWVILYSFLMVLIFWAAYEQAGGLLNLYADKFTDRMLGSFEIPAPWFQSVNPLQIILLAPLAAVFWSYLGRRKRNPHEVVKMAVGTMILGLGYVFMIAAVLQRDASSTHMSSMIWLVLVYLASTIGELWLSPVALAFITRAAPKRMTSQMVGWYFAVVGIGGFLASWLGSFAEHWGEMRVFVILTVVTTLVGVLQLLFAKKVIRLAGLPDESRS